MRDRRSHELAITGAAQKVFRQKRLKHRHPRDGLEAKQPLGLGRREPEAWLVCVCRANTLQLFFEWRREWAGHKTVIPREQEPW